MALSMNVTLDVPADTATGVSQTQELALNYTGDLLPWEFYVGGELKISYPIGALWDESVNPAQMSYPDSKWAPSELYSWYVRYATDANTKNWNGSSWDFTGLVYDVTETRTFTTVAAKPNNPTNPTPADNDTDVSRDLAQISWEDGGGADTFDVYYGPSGSTVLVSSNQVGVTWSIPSQLLNDQRYVWYIIAKNGQGNETGPVWDFYTEDVPAPDKAENPVPTDANTSVTLDQATISWDDGGGADTFDVYYGIESGNLTKVSTAQAGESFTVTGITNGSPYAYLSVRYWRIDSTNAGGTTTGDEWTFTTLRFDPPTRTYFYPGGGAGGKWYYYLVIQFDGSYGAHPWDGGVENTDWVYRPLEYEPNFIATIRKLVSVANSKIWFEDV